MMTAMDKNLMMFLIWVVVGGLIAYLIDRGIPMNGMFKIVFRVILILILIVLIITYLVPALTGLGH